MFELMLGKNSDDQPVLLIKLATADAVLTVPNAREFAIEILAMCRKADSGFAANSNQEI
jgi:hypothetical protein